MVPSVGASRRLLQGIGLRVAATGLFVVMSLCVRLASFDAPVGQIMFWRSSVALVPILLYLLWRGQFPRALKTKQPWGHVKRSGFGCASMALSFLSLSYLPLALATALSFLAPLVTIPIAAIFLRERPSPAVTGAAVLGFLGVGLILWPAFDGPQLDLGTLIGVAAGVTVAVTTAAAKVEIKRLTATEATGTIAFYFALVCGSVGLATAPFGWSPASGQTLLWLIGAGVTGGCAHIAMAEAVARAPVSMLAPFEYTAMLWAMLFDLLVFNLLPVPLSLIGAGVIVGAAALVAYGERRRTRPS
ncbi:membrane protein [Elstera cyanobacteriorum]|uniref:EamA family transporter n=1 Tax=Elstera cyanobacteriorum TaxID=2022747 RepID=A0A255XMB7_9PROT|nr:DMT family transporter [Elstera cyanobacteriorum]OYQ18096.1 EamA family transporter [Elstera cyanobacteriorum]GFZ83875.1 membrane protein [Elstera cyanobacteriorum]